MSIDRSRLGPWILATVAIVAIVAAMGALFALRSEQVSPLSPAPLRLALAPPDDTVVGGGPDYPFGLALAPDGRRLVFPAAKSGLVQLWLRDLTSGDTQPLPGTEEGVLPFWGPDGRAIGFFSGGRLRVITLEDAAVRDLADAPAPRGAAWHPGGDIIFAPEGEGGLLRRRGSDGAIERFTELAAGESSHRLPLVFDNGRQLLFFVRAAEPMRQGIWIAPFDQPADRQRLTGADSNGVVGGETMIYASDGVLLGQRLDLPARALTGRAVVLGTPVGRSPQNQLFATTAGDLLLYGAPSSPLREVRWFERSGTPAAALGGPMEAWDVRIAPGGTQVAVTGLDPQLNTLDIWAYDGDRPLPRRISPAIDVDESPAWAPDGARLAWVTGRRVVTTRGALAVLPDETLRKFANQVRVTDWSPDSQWIVGSESRPGTREDLWMLRADGSSEPTPYAASPFNEIQAAISPDGRWIAYASDESGRFEIYVDAFPVPGTRARVTTGGGVDPRWRADTAELYFRRGTEVHAVRPLNASGQPEAVSTERLFDAGAEIRAYDAAADGQRFLLNLPVAETAPQPINVIVHVADLFQTPRKDANTEGVK
jgi:Tol biopolymer transport system component